MIIATCDEAADPKGLKFLKGERPMGVRYAEAAKKKPAAGKASVYTINVNGKSYRVDVNGNDVAVNGKKYAVSLTEGAAAPATAPAAGAGKGVEVTAPMPGKVLGIVAGVGQAVKKGDAVITIEAMKMEQQITAPADGTIASINVAEGDMIETGQVVALM